MSVICSLYAKTFCTKSKPSHKTWHLVNFCSAEWQKKSKVSRCRLRWAESDWHAVCGAPSATAKENGEFSAASDYKTAEFRTGETRRTSAKLTAAKRSQRQQRAWRNLKTAESYGADRTKRGNAPCEGKPRFSRTSDFKTAESDGALLHAKANHALP